MDAIYRNYSSKVKHYADGQAWASSVLKNINSVAVGMSKSGTWDGTHDSLVSTIPSNGGQE